MLKEHNKRLLRWCEMIHAPDWLFAELVMPKDVYEMKIRPVIKGVITPTQVWRVHDVNPHPKGSYPYKGGLRLHPALTLETVKVLARDMTYKCSLACFPKNQLLVFKGLEM